MLEIGFPAFGLVLFVAAFSRIRKQMYGIGFLLVAAGIALLVHGDNLPDREICITHLTGDC